MNQYTESASQSQEPRIKMDHLPISLELEIQAIHRRIEDLQNRVATVHDAIKYNPHEAKTMYTRLWVRYAHEGLQSALNSLDGLNKHLTDIGMGITEVCELSKEIEAAANVNGGNDD